MPDPNEVPEVPERAAFAVADSLEALVKRYEMSHRLNRQQMQMLLLAFATHEAHELGYTATQYETMARECREEEWATPSVEAEAAAQKAPRIASAETVGDLAQLLRPHISAEQGYLVFVFDYGEVEDGRRVAYCGTVDRPHAARVLETVLDAWALAGISIEPTHRTIALLRMVVGEVQPHELAGVERHPHQRTPVSADPSQAAAAHLEAAAHHFALFKQETQLQFAEERARAKRESH